MLITENKVLRNLQEQVAKNKSDISDILEAKAVIAEFGIRVVGEVDTETELPDPATYSGEYGDAYTVGTQTPYDYYIFTRPNDDIPQAHWFNVGQFPMPGPQGEPGLPGAKGDKGSMIYVENTNPTLVTGYNAGDLWINNTDNALFQLNNVSWDRVGYVKGDTGPQGPKGDKGDTGAPGTPLNIVGVLSTVDLLPNPSTVNKATTYLVGASAPYTIYVIVGDINDKSTWEWQALAVGGTNVTVNNQPVGTFNADSKLDKMTTTSTYNRAYIVKQDGSQTLLNCGSDAGPYTLVSRTADSQIIVPETPTEAAHAASKAYVDNMAAGSGSALYLYHITFLGTSNDSTRYPVNFSFDFYTNKNISTLQDAFTYLLSNNKFLSASGVGLYNGNQAIINCIHFNFSDRVQVLGTYYDSSSSAFRNPAFIINYTNNGWGWRKVEMETN